MSSSLFRSLASNWLGLAAAAVIGFLLSPFVVRSLGPELYGVWALIVSINSQLVILDFGVRKALIKYVAEYRVRGDAQQLSALVSSATAMLLAAATVGFILLAAITPFLQNWFGIDQVYAGVAQVVFLISALDAASELLFGVFDGTLAGSERYDTINIINVTRLLANATLVVVVLNAGYGILGLVLVVFITRLGQRVWMGLATHHYNPGLALSPALINWQHCRTIAGYGGWASVGVLSTRLIYNIDSLVVGYFLGPLAVALYAVPLIIVDQFKNIAMAGNQILTPRFSQLHASGDRGTSTLLIEKWLTFNSLLAICIATPLLVLGREFLTLWMGLHFAESYTVLFYLCLPFLFTLPSLALTSFLYATANHKKNAQLQLLEAGLNVLLSVLLARSYGIVGVALGTLIPAVLFRGLILPWQAAPLTPVSFVRYLFCSYITPLPLLVGYLALLLGLASWIGAQSWGGFFAVCGLSLLAFAAATYSFYLGPNERAYLARRFRASRS